MVKEAEENKVEDQKIKDKIDSKNKLEVFLFQLKGLKENEMIVSKLSDEENKIVETTIQETEEWLLQEENDSLEQYESKINELSQKLDPILSKVQENPAAADPSTDTQGPVVDEVD